ncbi:MAG: hypothetical protein AAGU11_20560, partial [Syntrophobacteraceae bacterium]
MVILVLLAALCFAPVSRSLAAGGRLLSQFSDDLSGSSIEKRLRGSVLFNCAIRPASDGLKDGKLIAPSTSGIPELEPPVSRRI